MSVRFVPLDAQDEFPPGRLAEIVGLLRDALQGLWRRNGSMSLWCLAIALSPGGTATVLPIALPLSPSMLIPSAPVGRSGLSDSSFGLSSRTNCITPCGRKASAMDAR